MAEGVVLLGCLEVCSWAKGERVIVVRGCGYGGGSGGGCVRDIAGEGVGDHIFISRPISDVAVVLVHELM